MATVEQDEHARQHGYPTWEAYMETVYYRPQPITQLPDPTTREIIWDEDGMYDLVPPMVCAYDQCTNLGHPGRQPWPLCTAHELGIGSGVFYPRLKGDRPIVWTTAMERFRLREIPDSSTLRIDIPPPKAHT